MKEGMFGQCTIWQLCCKREQKAWEQTLPKLLSSTQVPLTPVAMFSQCLALLRETGTEGVDAEPAKAVKLFESAIDGGNGTSMVSLARLLTRGAEGVDVDIARAIALYTRAIQESNDRGQIDLAVFGLTMLQKSLQNGNIYNSGVADSSS